MNLSDAQIMATKLMEQHGLIENGWNFRFDNAKRRFGLCHHGTKTISLSRHLVELNSEHHVRQTILHEIAHALVDRNHGHDAVWKQMATKIGHSGERCYSNEVIRPQIEHRTLYLATCLNCKRRIYRHRKSFGLACGQCCKKLNNNKWSDDYLFNWTLIRDKRKVKS